MSIRVEQRIWKADVFITFPQYGCQGEQLTLPGLPCDDNNAYIAYVLKANQAILPSVYSMKLYVRIFWFKTKSICLILVYLLWDAEWVVISGLVPIILYYKLYLSLNTIGKDESANRVSTMWHISQSWVKFAQLICWKPCYVYFSTLQPSRSDC